MLCGSMACFKTRIRSSAAGPCSTSRYFIFFWPTPCSPVQVPSMASGAAHQPLDESLAGGDLGRVVRVHERLNMEIAVAHMADDGRDEAAFLDVPLGLVDAFGEARDRHADIGRDRLRAGTQAPAAQ